MEKVVLIDGNNLIFRSYYATAYRGELLTNSKGLPTNAIYAYVQMLIKIIAEEKPTHIMVAFDKGKTFRHESYDDYKGGRNETPSELKQQIPYAKQITRAMGITVEELENYEADDIIGTYSKKIETEVLLVSSDRDLLQLISPNVKMKLLKMKDFIYYDEKSFYEDYGIKPIEVIDLKALMGDSSDNIKGVTGIGEKTALKLIKEYHTIDNLYKNIDNLKGKIKENLLNDKESAYKSLELATIYLNVPIEVNLEKIVYKGSDEEELNSLLKELEFTSLFNKMKMKKELIIDSGFKDEFNKPVMIFPPSIFIIDSITTVLSTTFSPDNTKEASDAEKMRGNTEGARDAKTLKGFFKDILPLCKEANIIIFAVNHLNSNMSMSSFVLVMSMLMTYEQCRS